MTQTARKGNGVSSWKDVEDAYQPAQQVVTLGKTSFRIQEIDGRGRFEAAERSDGDRWELMLWMCDRGIVDPRPPSMEVFEQFMNPEHVLDLAKEIMTLSGMRIDDEEEAENASATVSGIGTS